MVPRKNCQKVSKNFLTLFDDFWRFLPCAKIVEKCRKTFWHFLTIFDVFWRGPFPPALLQSADKTEVALQFSESCAAEVALQHSFFCSVDVVVFTKAVLQQAKNCTATLQKLRCKKVALSCNFQAPTFRHPRSGPADLKRLAWVKRSGYLRFGALDPKRKYVFTGLGLIGAA